MLALLCCLPLQALPHVDGLRDGEALRPVSRAEEAARPAGPVARGRVVDARTGWPVAGATVETWTEELAGAGVGLQLVARATSARDGGFLVGLRREIEGSGAGEPLAAEKALVRAPGYLTWPGTPDELDLVRLMPRPAWTRSVKVVDLEDHPIAGARITSTYSCAHDVPAFEVVTGADGVAELPEYGLQQHTGDLRVRAPGYVPLKYVDSDEVPADPDGGAPALLRLARQAGFGARVLTHDGAPLANRRLHVVDGEGYHAPSTDARGAFAVEGSYRGRDLTLQVLESGPDTSVFSGDLPGREVALRVDARRWPESTPTGTLVVSAPCDEVTLFSEHGWAESVGLPGDGAVEFPAGKVLARVGQPFSGWEPSEREVELPAGETVELALAPRAEPRIAVFVPPDAERVVVQAGDRSIELEPRDGRVETPVPADERLVVLCDGKRTRRRIVEPIPSPAEDVESVHTLDLRGDEHLLPATRAQLAPEAPRVRLDVEIARTGPKPGRPVPDAPIGKLEAHGPGDPTVEYVGPGRFAVDAPAGYAVLLRFEGPGLADCWTSVPTSAGHVTLAPTHLARLELVDDTAAGFTVEGPVSVRLDELHPGPLSLTLAFGDARRATLDLELAPGERRSLRVRD